MGFEFLRDLIDLISKKVTRIGDYIRLRAVCQLWRSSSEPQPRHLPTQPPWLSLPYQIDGDSHRRFYDISTSKIHRLDLAETRGAEICGSSHGWLLLWKDQAMSLFNPITHMTMSLPPFSGIPSTVGLSPIGMPENYLENWNLNSFAVSPSQYFSISKAILTSSPNDPSCLVIFAGSESWKLGFCRIGAEKWTVVEFENPIFVDNVHFEDFTYSKGTLFTIDGMGTVASYDLIKHMRTVLNVGKMKGSWQLVDGVSQDLIGIHSIDRFDADGVRAEDDFSLYELKDSDWVELKDLSENVIFLGNFRATSLSRANLPDWCTNCLMYDSFRMDSRSPEQSPWYILKIKSFRLDDREESDVTEDLGTLQDTKNWQPPLWFTPSF